MTTQEDKVVALRRVEKLDTPPNGRNLMLRAALGALPIPGLNRRGGGLPLKTLELTGVKVDSENLAAYTRVCGLRFSDTLPLTYPFTLVTPLTLKLMVDKSFPYPAVGLVHAENVIERFRPISMSEPLDIRVHAENSREHAKGMLFDIVSEVSVGRELVWRNVATILHQQRTSLSGGPKPEPKPEEVPPPPQKALKVGQPTISKYAAVSGDRNPIHTSTLGAKALGFPATIAHGAWEMATILQLVEGRIPDKATYEVKFGKPVLLPATLNLYAAQADGPTAGPVTWDLSIKHPKKGYPHLTGTLTG